MTDVIFVMDDLGAIKTEKDTTFALMLEAQRRDLPVWYANESDLSLAGGDCLARLRRVELHDQPSDYYRVLDERKRALGSGDLVLMRSDPPVDDSYIYATHLLDCAGFAGARIVNRPDSLRGFNEKLAIARFPDLIAETLVSSSMADLRAFVTRIGRAVVKPLDGMGGRGIFMAVADDPNLGVILETLSANGSRLVMAQQFLPGIADGDKRVLMVAGQAVPYMLARIPGQSDFRGNLARGGRGEGRELTETERRIAEIVGPVLVEHGIDFAGLDIIDGRLTEINVTSPTCVRELDREFGLNIAAMLYDALGY